MRELLHIISKQSPLRLLLLVIILVITFSAYSFAQTGIVAGYKANSDNNFLHLGIIKKLSPATAVYFSAEAGTDEYNFRPTGVYIIPFSENIVAGLIGGADVGLYKENPTDEELLTYLSLATGISLNIKLSKQFSIFTSFDYIKNESIENNTRFGIGAVFWLPVE